MNRLVSPGRHALAVTATILLALGLLLSTALTGGTPSTAIGDPRLDLPPLQGPGEFFDSQRAVGVDAIDYGAAIDEAFAMDAVEGTWDLLGPTNIGGRSVDVAVMPGRPNEVWNAAASGGVWHSIDRGATWSRAWPDDITQSLGALAAGGGVLYAGTGEANPGGGSIVYGGTGLYRSTDLGQTWELSGMPDSGAFGRIMVDPTDDNVVWAAASGQLFVDPADGEFTPGDRGLWKSLDKGETWTKVFTLEGTALDAFAETTGAVDIAIDPSDSDRVLVAMWDHYRTPEKRVYAGPGSSVWLTEDGGATWEHLDEITITTDPNANDEFTTEDEKGRIGVAFSLTDPSQAYAMIANTLDGTHGAWFSSTDGGRSFTESNPAGLAANNSSYGWWFARIYTDPVVPGRMYAMGLELLESVDGGGRFVAQSNVLAGVVTGVFQGNVHADQHAMAWSPDVPGLVYLANDGGTYVSSSNGAAGTWVAGVQGWTQHYSVDVDEQTAEMVVSGLQDNLCQMHVGASGGELASGAWAKYGFCGDGIVTRIDPEDPTTQYYCSQYGGCGRSVAGAPLLVGGMRMPNDRYGWLADIQFDPNDSQIIYTGGNRLNRSTNRGTNFTRLSGDLSTNPVQEDPNSGYRLRGVVTTIATHPNGETVWVGTDEGRLWVTHKATEVRPSEDDDGRQINGDGWTLVDDGDASTDDQAYQAGDDSILPERTWISSITVDPTDPSGNTAYVAYTGFRQNDEDARLFVTRDGGLTFESITEGLPVAPINDVILIDGTVWIGSDVGVFTLDDEAGWLRVGDLPAVPVLELRHHQGTNTLTAATFGHGVRRLALDDVSTSGAGSLVASLTE